VYTYNIYMYMYMYMCINIHILTRTHAHTHTHTHTHIHTQRDTIPVGLVHQQWKIRIIYRFLKFVHLFFQFLTNIHTQTDTNFSQNVSLFSLYFSQTYTHRHTQTDTIPVGLAHQHWMSGEGSTAGVRPAPPQRDPRNLCLQGKWMPLTLRSAYQEGKPPPHLRGGNRPEGAAGGRGHPEPEMAGSLSCDEGKRDLAI